MEQEYLRGYKDVKIFKTQKLGVGSYGAVYRANCDHLPCAAKLLHPTLLDHSVLEENQPEQGKEHRKPMDRFQQECHFLSQFRHPNIIQYIGVCWDSSSSLPVLLMELMDESMTQFLDRHTQNPLPFHSAVNICQDIALAIAFLHTNGICHRDLSSNNILMLGDRRAKVTDFGMAKLYEASGTKTRVPGTDVYMPPESIEETPEYSEKLDVFSYGVLVIQILCRRFPKPSKRMRSVPGGSMYEKVSEAERRKKHIDLIPPNHPLLPLALECISDSEVDRPTSKEVAGKFKPLKTSLQYSNSEKGAEEHMEALKRLVQTSDNKDEIVSRLLSKIEEKNYALTTLEDELKQKDEDFQFLQRSYNIRLQDLEAEKESQAARFKARMDILERMLAEAQDRTDITMTTQESARAPRAMYRMSNAVQNGDVIYFAVTGDVYEDALYCLNLSEGEWSTLPAISEDRKWYTNTIAIVDGDLTTVGGCDEDENVTNQLFTYISRDGHEKWEEHLPPMKHKRDSAIAFTYGSYLVVAGGVSDGDRHLKSVEVLDTMAMQWAESVPLLEPLSSACAILCNSNVYLLGGWASEKMPTSAVHTCSVADLVGNARSTREKTRDVWKKIADLPVLKSTAINYRGHLIAVGGVDVMNRATTIVQRYDKASNSWVVIGHLLVPRGQPFAMVLPQYDVTLVIGGHKGYYINKIYEVEEVCFHIQN